MPTGVGEEVLDGDNKTAADLEANATSLIRGLLVISFFVNGMDGVSGEIGLASVEAVVDASARRCDGSTARGSRSKYGFRCPRSGTGNTIEGPIP